MFSNIPPYTAIRVPNLIESIPKAFEIFHGTANGSSYRSAGELRKNEEHCIFHFTVRGQGEVRRLGKTYRTKAGEGFFNIINEENSGYGYPENGQEPWEFVVICFDGGNTRDIVSELLNKQVVYTLSGHETVFGKMCLELYEKEWASLTFLPNLIRLLIEPIKPDMWIVNNFKSITERELMKNPTVASIAQEMQLSREYLTRVYTEMTGETPSKYIKGKRFELLCELLVTNKRLDEIARMMSFPSVAGMGIFFKSMSKTTLTAYRKNGYLSV